MYNEVFGGGSINPSQRTYLSLETSVDVALKWPVEQQIAGADVAADIIDVDATAPGLNVDFDDATIVSNGYTSLITNIGSNTVTIRDSAGGTIISLAPGESWFIYLTDNSTAAGVWRTFQLGATVSVASASALAGAGIKAISTTLNQRMAPTLTSSTPITWTDSNRAQLTIWTGGVGVLDLPAAGTVGSDWFGVVRNEGTGNLTVTPASGTIDSAATLIMAPGTSAILVTDGTDFFSVGLGTSTTGSFDHVVIDIPGSGDFTLSGVQLNRISYKFTGILTGDRKIIVPNTVQEYWVDNSTTGAFNLEVATAAQVTPIQVVQSNRAILYCDGTDVIDADTSSLTPPITIGQGGTGATDAPTALSNLGGVGTTRLINTAANSGLGGGGDLSADRSHVVDVDNLVTELTVDAAADTMAFYDDSVSGTRKTPIASAVRDVTPSETQTGVVELATQVEVDAGADAVRVVTPATLEGSLPIIKAKPSTQNKSTDDVLADDDDLVFPDLVADTEYLIEGYLEIGVPTTEKMKMAMDVTNAVQFGTWAYHTSDLNANATADSRNVNGAVSTVASGAGTAQVMFVKGYIKTHLTLTSELALQWAQSVSGGANTSINRGSWIKLTKIRN